MALPTAGGDSKSLNRVQIYSTPVEQTKIISFSEFSGNKLREEGPEVSSYVNKWHGEKNKVICNKKSFIKNPCSHCFCFEILFLVF